MRNRLRQALEDGLILGVKVGIVVLVITMLSGWLVRDYLIIRARSFNGQVAYEYLAKQEQDKNNVAKAK